MDLRIIQVSMSYILSWMRAILNHGVSDDDLPPSCTYMYLAIKMLISFYIANPRFYFMGFKFTEKVDV